MPCILCMANHFNFDDFSPDTPIPGNKEVGTGSGAAPDSLGTVEATEWRAARGNGSGAAVAPHMVQGTPVTGNKRVLGIPTLKSTATRLTIINRGGARASKKEKSN
ncbi:unnamed protein product [Amoebophrya sp. A120]|nr:unnamed protein product [Amoebophrya sp. A120]|eukprot:GSA120T00013396001.1